jgi:peroxiredoxin
MNRRIVWLLVALGCIAAVAIVAPFFLTPSSKPSGPAGLAGEPAPAFDLLDTAGHRVSLADYRGKVVVMNLWASWCPPCRAEMPDLQRLSSLDAARGVEVVGVNQGESAQRASAFAQSLRITYPIWLDDRQQYGRLYTALGLPTTVIVGRNGVVVAGYDGALSFDQLQTDVAGAIAAR